MLYDIPDFGVSSTSGHNPSKASSNSGYSSNHSSRITSARSTTYKGTSSSSSGSSGVGLLAQGSVSSDIVMNAMDSSTINSTNSGGMASQRSHRIPPVPPK
jgi:hypothetical protein